MEEHKVNKEDLVKAIEENINNIKESIMSLDLERTKAREIFSLMKFYMGNESLHIKMTMTVNLHQIKSETLLATNVTKYKEMLDSTIDRTTTEINAYGKMLEELAEKLSGDDNGTETTT